MWYGLKSSSPFIIYHLCSQWIRNNKFISFCVSLCNVIAVNVLKARIRITWAYNCIWLDCSQSACAEALHKPIFSYTPRAERPRGTPQIHEVIWNYSTSWSRLYRSVCGNFGILHVIQCYVMSIFSPLIGDRKTFISLNKLGQWWKIFRYRVPLSTMSNKNRKFFLIQTPQIKYKRSVQAVVYCWAELG